MLIDSSELPKKLDLVIESPDLRVNAKTKQHSRMEAEAAGASPAKAFHRIEKISEKHGCPLGTCSVRNDV